MPTPTYNKVAQFIKPLVKSTRYSNGDIVSMPYPHDNNSKWPRGTATIFKFQMQDTEGYTYKEQSLSDMLQQGVLTVVMPRIDWKEGLWHGLMYLRGSYTKYVN